MGKGRAIMAYNRDDHGGYTDCNDCLEAGKVQGDMKTMSETGGLRRIQVHVQRPFVNEC
jgi:hypothetical protein